MKEMSNLLSADLAVFAGQSNMSGRGSADSAVKCRPNAGFEYKSVSNPAMLVPLTEPFGLGEDKEGAISDYDSKGGTKRTGSLVSAAIDEYYAQTGRTLIAVSASIGGSSTTGWKKIYVKDAVQRLDKAKEFLKKNQINVGRIFIVWCQGESDGDAGITAEDYMTNTKEIFHILQMHGAEKCFLIQIGHYNYVDYPAETCGLTGKQWDYQYRIIRNAQWDLCQREEDFILAGSFEPYLNNMKDRYHYYQSAYNAVGRTTGASIARFYEADLL